MTDVMIDLEMMGISPNAAIVSIGAVEFDMTTNTLGRSFYRVVDLKTAVAEGGVIDADTVLWWLHQSNQARSDICDEGIHIRDALNQFSKWLAVSGENVKVWGNGAAFDNVILAQAYRRAGLPVPWSFRNDRCYRTMKAMYPNVPIEHIGTYHNALHDAVSQARHLMTMLMGETK